MGEIFIRFNAMEKFFEDLGSYAAQRCRGAYCDALAGLENFEDVAKTGVDLGEARGYSLTIRRMVADTKSSLMQVCIYVRGI